jgi:acetyltransferase-like isoleucine patch superfamily enzyme
MDADFHGLRSDERDTPGVTRPVVVEDDVWFCADVTVLFSWGTP